MYTHEKVCMYTYVDSMGKLGGATWFTEVEYAHAESLKQTT